MTGADGEVRQLNKDDIARMRPARDVLPAELLAVLPKRRPGQRGSQKAPRRGGQRRGVRQCEEG